VYDHQVVLNAKKLTITIDEQVYEGLYAVVGRHRISRFIENLVRPYVLHQEMEDAYKKWLKMKNVKRKLWRGRKQL